MGEGLGVGFARTCALGAAFGDAYFQVILDGRPVGDLEYPDHPRNGRAPLPHQLVMGIRLKRDRAAQMAPLDTTSPRHDAASLQQGYTEWRATGHQELTGGVEYCQEYLHVQSISALLSLAGNRWLLVFAA
jgi:hypothetical protein